MITGDYAREMARYGHWQNKQLAAFFARLSEADLHQDRGAFFGSILGTANHLLWGDWIWISRFDGGQGPGGGISESVLLCEGLAQWLPLREEIDKRIGDWAATLGAELLDGDFSWFSAAKGAEVTRPFAQCIVHMFNHQTHHRGQIHQMLTALGSDAPVSDLVFLPQEG